MHGQEVASGMGFDATDESDNCAVAKYKVRLTLSMNMGVPTVQPTACPRFMRRSAETGFSHQKI